MAFFSEGDDLLVLGHGAVMPASGHSLQHADEEPFVGEHHFSLFLVSFSLCGRLA
jgi:hypothetical protein